MLNSKPGFYSGAGVVVASVVMAVVMVAVVKVVTVGVAGLFHPAGVRRIRAKYC